MIKTVSAVPYVRIIYKNVYLYKEKFRPSHFTA